MQKTAFSRVSWIDICRGIGILLVLYAHVLGNQGLRYLIYAFHMPLFFFISGMVFRPQKQKGFPSLLYKSFTSILLPYFIFAFISYTFWLIKQPISAHSYEEVSRQLYGILYGSGNNGLLRFNIVLWFLPCLFVTKVLFASIAKLTTHTRRMGMILFVFALAGYLYSLFFPKTILPLGAETALTAVVFFGAGYLWNNTERIHTFMQKRSYWILLISSILTLFFASLSHGIYGRQVDMRLNLLHNFFLFYLGAFSGIVCCIVVSMLIRKNTLLEYIGRHSMILFVWHTLLFSYFTELRYSFVAQEIVNTIRFLIPTVYTAFGVGIILTINVCLKRVKGMYNLLFTKK